jgi:UDP-glucose 4-epimerase
MEMKNKKVMVVGGAGFIGSHLVDALIEEGAIVCVVDNLFLGKADNVNPSAVFAYVDACNFSQLISVVKSFRPDLIYNLAVKPLPHSLKNPVGNIECNIKIVQNLCEVVRGSSCNQLIQFSSSEVYGSAQYEPMCENHPWKASTPYAASKAAGDMICLSYVRTFGCNISILRPFNNYGPRQNAGSYAGIIPLTIERIKKGENPIIYGDGEQTRDYIYVEDTARAAMMMGKRDDLAGEVFNIASGHDYSVNWLVQEIMSLMEEQNYPDMHPIKMESARPGDIRRHIANVLKAKDVLGFEHTTPMDEGLRKTVKWYLSQG